MPSLRVLLTVRAGAVVGAAMGGLAGAITAEEAGGTSHVADVEVSSSHHKPACRSRACCRCRL